MALAFDPSLPEVRTNPYPLYQRLREEDPVHWSDALDAWVLTRYDDVSAVLKDLRFSAERRRARNRFIQQAPTSAQEYGAAEAANTMLTSDPPEHTRLRLLVSKAFLPRNVEPLRPHVQRIADELLDDLPEPGRLDILLDFAYPLPVIVIAELMGLPTEDRAQFKRWSDDIVATLGATTTAPELAERAAHSGSEAIAYFREIIAARRRQPKDDLVTVLVKAADEDRALTEPQLLATCVTMLIAGNETTRNLIANGMLALLHHPSELERLWNDPTLVETAVEELLRYAGPVQCTTRVATEEIEIGGKRIEQGQLVYTMLAAANRDPAHFPDPERLDVGRKDNHHIAFGYGVHACLGQPLARLEAQVAFSTLAKRIRGPALATNHLEWGPSFILRGLKSLPITYAA